MDCGPLKNVQSSCCACNCLARVLHSRLGGPGHNKHAISTAVPQAGCVNAAGRAPRGESSSQQLREIQYCDLGVTALLKELRPSWDGSKITYMPVLSALHHTPLASKCCLLAACSQSCDKRGVMPVPKFQPCVSVGPLFPIPAGGTPLRCLQVSAGKHEELGSCPLHDYEGLILAVKLH